MNLKEMNLVELKAIAYDTFAGIQNLQNDLMIINQEIATRSQRIEIPREEVKQEKKEKEKK